MAEPIQNLIPLLNRGTLERDLLDLVSERLGDGETVDRQVEHLVGVLTNPLLLATSLYDLLRLSHLEEGCPLPIANMRFWKGLHEEGPEVIHRVLQAPDAMKAVGDKCLFDHAVAAGPEPEGMDLETLGSRAYARASQILEVLADDRRLRTFYEANRLHRVTLPEEIAFLHGCALKFGLYGEILREIVSSTTRLMEEGPGKSGHPAKSGPPPAPESRANSLALPRIHLGHTEEAAVPEEAATEDAGCLVEAAGEENPAQILSCLERWVLFSSLDVESLRRRLETFVVNQSEAIDRLCDDLSLYASGTVDPRRPGSYFLLGPTGVGKNYLVEQVVEGFRGLWGIEVPYVLIEGPQYTYPSDINELKGAARGFIRSDEDGILTEFHKRSSKAPLAVVIIDEVEKAHQQLRRFFLSVMDRGTMTDNRGEILNFSNTIFFYTSNVGYSDAARNTKPIGYGDQASRDRAFVQSLEQEVRRQLSPEFMNRVTMLHFNYLSRDDAERVFDLEFAKIARRYQQRQDIEVTCTPRARRQIMDTGFDRDYGARNLTTVLNRVVNIGVGRRLRRDDPPGGRDVSEVLEAIRKGREASEAVDLRELERRAKEAARVRVLYRRVVVDYEEGEFLFDPR